MTDSLKNEWMNNKWRRITNEWMNVRDKGEGIEREHSSDRFQWNSIHSSVSSEGRKNKNKTQVYVCVVCSRRKREGWGLVKRRGALLIKTFSLYFFTSCRHVHCNNNILHGGSTTTDYCESWIENWTTTTLSISGYSIYQTKCTYYV